MVSFFICRSQASGKGLHYLFAYRLEAISHAYMCVRALSIRLHALPYNIAIFSREILWPYLPLSNQDGGQVKFN